MDDKMARRGVKAMERSLRNMKKAKDKFCRYTNNYRHLAETGDKAMTKAWREANKIRENWVKPERLHTIPEGDEPQDVPPEPPNEAPMEATSEIPPLGEETQPRE